ncbi:MAG: MFS transporter [Bacteroidetes bacterium]|nr:MFS transporter [Bacteroidota bacterium]
MRQKLLSILNIRQTESRYVFDLLPVQFFIGISTSFINIIAFAFFIHEYSITQLPYGYLTVAICLILVNVFYQKLEHKYPPLVLLKHIITFSALIIVLLWVGLRFINEHVFTFLLFVWSVIFYMISGYAFWGLVSLLFNVRESKRVFSIVGSGDIPAKLIGYLSASLLMPLIGTNNLIWLAFASLIVGLVLLNRVIHKRNWERIVDHSHVHDHHIDTSLKERNHFTFFFENPLILTISLLSLISYNVFNLIDFTFLSQVKLKYDTVQSLAAFVSILLGLGRLIALAMKLILTSRAIERLGIITCLFITPITLIAFCLVFLLGIHQTEQYVYVFGLMALITEVLRSTIQEPVFFILFQPLKESLRLKGHIISKGYMLAPSLIIVGLSLIIFYKTGIQLTIPLTFKIIVLNLILWGIIIYFIRSAYLKTLHSSIRKGLFSSEDVHIHDQQTADILINKIRSGKENEIIFALNLLENASHPSFETLLKEQLQSPFPDVRSFVLDRMDALKWLNPQILQETMDKETDADVKQKILSLLCSYDDRFLTKASASLHSYEGEMKKTLITALLNQPEFTYLLTAGNELNQLINSAETKDKLIAIEIIGELKNTRFTNGLRQLLNDGDLIVKRNAIITVCKLKLKELVPDITELFDHPIERYIAMQGFIQYGDDFFTDNTGHIEKTSGHEDLYVKIAAKIKGPNSTAYLLSKLEEPIPEKIKLVHALWAKGFSADTKEETEKLHDVLDKHLAASLEKIKYFHALPETKDYSLMKKSVESEISSDLGIALKLCAILYNRNEVNRTLELIDTGQQSRMINAMEVLEMALPKRIMRDVNHLFDFLLDPTHKLKSVSRQDVPLVVKEIVFKKELLFQPWSKSICIYGSWKNNISEVLLHLKNQPDSENNNLLFRETRDHILKELN